MFKLFVFTFFLLTTTTFCQKNNKKLTTTPLTDICLNCIAESISSCDVSINCREKKCGLFKITMPYWIDGGKPTLVEDDDENDDDDEDENDVDRIAFTKCTTDYKCAVKTVRGYMKVYKKDCNGDGIINCNDYMAIHKNGPGGCGDKLPKKYTRKFNACIDREETKSFTIVESLKK